MNSKKHLVCTKISLFKIQNRIFFWERLRGHNLSRDPSPVGIECKWGVVPRLDPHAFGARRLELGVPKFLFFFKEPIPALLITVLLLQVQSYDYFRLQTILSHNFLHFDKVTYTVYIVSLHKFVHCRLLLFSRTDEIVT